MSRSKFLPILLLAVTPLVAQAHTSAGPVHGFFHGVEHPLFGLDHLLAMVAVGLWAAQLGGRALWAIPASFLGLMALGGVLGMTGVPLPMVETGILTSVFLLGILIFFALRPPLWAGSLIVGVFALFHGYAHGTEMPAETSGLTYAAGFLLATAALHLTGLGAGLALSRTSPAPVLRMAGALVILAGGLLAIR